MGLISNGTTIFDNGSMASGFGGNLVFISKQTASSDASISFTSGIDSTYKEYVFYFNNIHPATDNAHFQFNLSTDSGSNYNVTKTTTLFKARLAENDTQAELGYESGSDLAQSTSFQPFTYNGISNDNDSSLSGFCHIFNPSSSVFVKHFLAQCHYMSKSGTTRVAYNSFTAGYGNTTSAVDAIQFSMSSGNIDSGDILLYGVN